MNDHDVTFAHSWAAAVLMDALANVPHGLTPTEVLAVQHLAHDLDDEWVV